MNILSKKRLSLVVTVFVVALLLAGCFSVGAPVPVPTPPATKVTGTIVVPEGTLGTSASTDSAFAVMSASLRSAAQMDSVTGTVPVAGATVEAYELPSLRKLPPTAVTDEDGNYELKGLPTDTPIIIKATKKVAGDGGRQEELRLSTYVPSVGKETSADVDAATSLATEALAQRISNNPSDFEADESLNNMWESARESARRIVQELADSADEDGLANLLVVGKGAIQPGDIGSGLDEEYDEEIGLPDDPMSDEGRARAMVQALRNAGYSIQDTFELRLADVYENVMDEFAPHIEEISSLIGLGMEVFLLVDQYPDGGVFDNLEWQWEFTPADGSSPTGGKTWTVHVYENYYYEEWNPVGGELIETYTITRKYNNEYTLTAKNVEHQITIHYNGMESLFESLTLNAELDGYIKLATGETVSFEDVQASTVFREEQIFDGWTPVYLATHQEFNGTIRSEIFTLDGSLEVEAEEFPYCEAWEDHYGDEPQIEYWCYAPPRFIDVSGKLELETLTVSGSFFMRADNPVPDDVLEWHNPEGGAMKLTGDIELRGGVGLEPVRMSGTLELEGHVTEPSASPYEPDEVAGEVTFYGELEMPGYAPMTLDIVLTVDGMEDLTSQVTYIRGNNRLVGEATITLAEKFHVDLYLENEDGIEIELTYVEGGENATGVIRSRNSGEELATIEAGGPEVIRVHYASGYYESLF